MGVVERGNGVAWLLRGNPWQQPNDKNTGGRPRRKGGITQKVDSEVFVLRQDLGGQLNDLREAIKFLMESLEAMK